MDKRVQFAAALMQGDLRRDRSPDELARGVGLSRWRFRHLFKAEAGTTPARHLRALRLAHAKELLAGSLLSVKEVMTSVGIKDKSHFTREFRKAYGLTPTEYCAATPLSSVAKKGRT